MKIVVCASVAHLEKIGNVKQTLEQLGHVVEAPEDSRLHGSSIETAAQRAALMRRFFEKIHKCDAVLILNEEKNGIPGYVGGNTLIELGYAFALRKRCYIYNDIPQLSYTDELAAMAPEVINGDLSKIIAE